MSFIKAAITKMDGLINAILKLSREGRRNFQPEPLAMTALVQGLADAQRHQAETAGAAITIGDLPGLVADRVAVEQIFGNLIDNAIKYLDRNRPGRIAVTGAVSDGLAVFQVADNGRGIDARDHGRVFELFRRSGAQDRPGEGSGSPMSAPWCGRSAGGSTSPRRSGWAQPSRSRCRCGRADPGLRGRAALTRSRCFRCRPRAQAPECSLERLAGARLPPRPRSAGTDERMPAWPGPCRGGRRQVPAVHIVMIEDDEGHARLIERNIRRAGVNNVIESFRDGTSALAALFGPDGSGEINAGRPLLILLDLNLPDMTGIDILQKVKSNPHLKRSPVVILTTTDDQREIQRCYDLGCNVYITKPVNYEGFANAIRQLGLFFSVMQVPESA